jgi:hypothetical protein
MKNWILARAAWMDANMFGTCHSLGIFEEPQQILKLFPNPSSDIFYIEGLASAITIEIRNEMGQCIESFSSNSEIVSFDASRFSNGLYFVKVKDSTQEPIKLVILH